jgi:NADPH:quinone reductase-like Zn-dependent oxidoreductase
MAGTVEAAGHGVSGFGPGDHVFGVCPGSFAEYVSVRTDKLALKPSNLSFDEAAAVPISGLTALQAVHDHGGVKAGQQVLIVGASGGVGSFRGADRQGFRSRVTGVCSTGEVDLVRALGAIEAGQVKPAIDQTYPLSEVATAIRDLVDGRARGKIVMTIRWTTGQLPVVSAATSGVVVAEAVVSLSSGLPVGR